MIYPESYACKKSGRTVGKQAIFGLPIGSIGCMVYLLTNLLRQLPANFQIAWILYLKVNHVMVFFTNQSFGRISRITPDFQHYTHYTGDRRGTCRCPLDPVLLVGSVPVAGVFFLSFFFVSSMSASFFPLPQHHSKRRHPTANGCPQQSKLLVDSLELSKGTHSLKFSVLCNFC